jgi:hypothetical protein
MVPPSFNQDLGFAQRAQGFAIEQFVSELRMKLSQ